MRLTDVEESIVPVFFLVGDRFENSVAFYQNQVHFGAVEVVMAILRTETTLIELPTFQFVVSLIPEHTEDLIIGLLFVECSRKLLGRKMINNTIIYRFDIILEPFVAEEVHCYYF